MIDHTCERCGAAFRAKRNANRLYCSRACAADERRRPLADRFWPNVDRSGGDDACWPWTASLTQAGGYGQIWCAETGRPEHAMRVAYYLTHGRWPHTTRHICDRPSCCNPAHLLDGTDADNTADRVDRGRDRVGVGSKPRLTDAAVRSIRDRYAAGGVTMRALADEHGIDHKTVHLLVTRKSRAHVV